MAEQNTDLCSNYQQHKDLDDFISDPSKDPNYLDFLLNYQLWEATGSPADLSDMFTFFGNPADSLRALEAGQGKPEGRVRKEHCEIHENFVVEGQKSLDELIQLITEQDSAFVPSGMSDFDIAVKAFLLGLPLNEAARGNLNGACLLYNEIDPVSLSGGQSSSEKEFYAIPGKLMTGSFQKKLSDPLWRVLRDQVVAATDAAGLKTINMDRVVQLRLGKDASAPVYPPVGGGSGIVIFGAG